jgi:hypothetical protein
MYSMTKNSVSRLWFGEKKFLFTFEPAWRPGPAAQAGQTSDLK